MKTIEIKGQQYVEVNERIKFFRENEKYKNWSLESEILSNENGVCIIKAIVKDENGIIKATGHAYEKENSTFINKTSYIENCETSAWGRALGNLGIGINVSIASADEIQNAILQSDSKPVKADKKSDDIFISLEQKNRLKEKLGGLEFAKVMNANNGKLTIEQFDKLMEK